MIKKATLFGHPEGHLVITPEMTGLYIFREKGDESKKYCAWDSIYILSVYYSKRKNSFFIKRRRGKTNLWVDQVMFDPSLLPEVAHVFYELGGTGMEKKTQDLDEIDKLMGELQRTT